MMQFSGYSNVQRATVQPRPRRGVATTTASERTVAFARMGRGRRPFARVYICSAIGLLGWSAGCAAPLRQPMSPDAQARFRTDAIKSLEDGAFGDDPAIRMQAIEAFQDVAPREGIALQAIPLNIENNYPGASFAALMAAGQIGATQLMDLVRTRAEHPDPNVRMAAILALHKFGDRSRTVELGQILLNHSDPKVRANAALVIGRMGGKAEIRLLRTALRRETKDLPKLQILEALATLGDKYATERLILDGYSEIPQQSAIALMMLANAHSDMAEDLFWFRMRSGRWPEVQLQAIRGLANLGHPQGLDTALKFLTFDAPQAGNPADPPEQQIRRVRGLAALALEAIGDPESLGALRRAFDETSQSDYVRLAVARAAVRLIDRSRPHLADDEKLRTPAAVQDRLAGDAETSGHND